MTLVCNIIIEFWHHAGHLLDICNFGVAKLGAGGVPSLGLPKTITLRPFSTHRLKDLFLRSSNLQYFKRLIQIPQLPEVSVPGHTQALQGLQVFLS